MPGHTPSPVDLPGSTLIGGRPLRWTTVTIMVASLFLAATNAIAINGWAVELEPSPTSARIVAASEWWMDMTGRLRLGAPRAAVHDLWRRVQDARF